MSSSRLPEGYLGATARITSGPAPELVEAGYALEIGDAPLLHRGLTLADLAHLAELVDCDALTRAEAAPVGAALLRLLAAPAADFPYDPVYGDAYNSRERELERELGGAAGRLHLGRTRREAGRIAFRLALRDRLLGLHADVAALAVAIADQAARHAATLWADTTYLQPAQPATFGHYLGAFAEQAVRHLDRLETAYQRVDYSPGGAGGVGGTRLPLDRARLARRLGFGAVGMHTRDAMWSVDVLADAVLAAAQAVATLSQLASDLEIFASPAFGYVTLDASLCRASVLMPQKRNPYALPVLRGGAGTLVGRLTGLLATGLTPSARTDNWLYAYGEVAGALDLAGRLVRLGCAVVVGLSVHADVLAEQAASHFTAAADLAEDLAQRFRLDYRTAYRVVGQAVAVAVDSGAEALTAPMVRSAAARITGAELPITGDMLREMSDPAAAVLARSALGGASPARVKEHARRVRHRAGAARRWNCARRARIEEAEAGLLDAMQALVCDAGRPDSEGNSPTISSD
jgi:argininosuccinate lyase